MQPYPLILFFLHKILEKPPCLGKLRLAKCLGAQKELLKVDGQTRKESNGEDIF